jgi:hypothetical protein
MSARVLGFISPETPWGEPVHQFFCIVCDVQCELDNHEPFCSDACRNNYDGPPDDGEAWAGGFAENH